MSTRTTEIEARQVTTPDGVTITAATPPATSAIGILSPAFLADAGTGLLPNDPQHTASYNPPDFATTSTTESQTATNDPNITGILATFAQTASQNASGNINLQLGPQQSYATVDQSQQPVDTSSDSSAVTASNSFPNIIWILAAVGIAAFVYIKFFHKKKAAI